MTGGSGVDFVFDENLIRIAETVVEKLGQKVAAADIVAAVVAVLEPSANHAVAHAEALSGTAMGVSRRAVARLADADVALAAAVTWADEQRLARPGDPALDQLAALLAPWS